jgi:cyclic lactone autoinducer peptide
MSKNNARKKLLELVKKIVKFEAMKNGNDVLHYCPVILHQPQRPKSVRNEVDILIK